MESRNNRFVGRDNYDDYNNRNGNEYYNNEYYNDNRGGDLDYNYQDRNPYSPSPNQRRSSDNYHSQQHRSPSYVVRFYFFILIKKFITKIFYLMHRQI